MQLPVYRFSFLSRFPCQNVRLALRLFSKTIPLRAEHNTFKQIEYIKSEIQKDVCDWATLKQNILSKPGSVNEKNVDGILLKFMTNSKNYCAALSFSEHLMKASNELNLGSTNGLLGLYYAMGRENKLSNKEKSFILDSYRDLYDKYKVLDFATCERLLHALCVINEWKKALKVLQDIHISTTPTHSAYSTLIATMFRNKEKTEAMKLIEESVRNRRRLLDVAYEGWMNYILAQHSDKRAILQHLDEICLHISKNHAVITKETAEKIRDNYAALGWSAEFTKIRKLDGQCMICTDNLRCLRLNDEEFLTLQKSIKEKLIVGSDLFLNTSPKELERFLTFIEKTAPYDIVLDALNIAYTQKGYSKDKLAPLVTVVNYFLQQNKKILLLGRKHMLQWSKRSIEYLKNKTCYFFIDNLSKDDPYFITAAIVSGSHTHIVSKDLLRGHRFLLKDEHLRHLFERWQWQHQWMAFTHVKTKKLDIQAPLKFTPCAQKTNSSWHLPYEQSETEVAGQVNDGIPDLSSWLCLKPKI